jgi:putative (di)nucleoside polyphosphate hydrolase
MRERCKRSYSQRSRSQLSPGTAKLMRNEKINTAESFMNSAELPLRPNVCMLLFNSAGKLFLGERAGCPGVWQFPQGGAKKKLTLKQNVLKELHEEVGLSENLLKIENQLEAINEYEFRDPPEYAKDKWRGQSQTFWLVRFLGEDSDIDLNYEDPPEFMNWRWASIEEVKELAEPVRLAGYLAPLLEFEEYLSKNTVG